jgi:hypothetical protein
MSKPPKQEMDFPHADNLPATVASDTAKHPYTPPRLTVYGKVGQLTRGGASGVPEGPSQTSHKRA